MASIHLKNEHKFGNDSDPWKYRICSQNKCAVVGLGHIQYDCLSGKEHVKEMIMIIVVHMALLVQKIAFRGVRSSRVILVHVTR